MNGRKDRQTDGKTGKPTKSQSRLTCDKESFFFFADAKTDTSTAARETTESALFAAATELAATAAAAAELSSVAAATAPLRAEEAGFSSDNETLEDSVEGEMISPGEASIGNARATAVDVALVADVVAIAVVEMEPLSIDGKRRSPGGTDKEALVDSKYSDDVGS